MNFIDKLKEEMENQPLVPDEELHNDPLVSWIQNNVPQKRTDMTAEERQAEYTVMKEDTKALAESYIEVAEMFYARLKGKYSPKEINHMVNKFHDIMGGKR